MTLPKRAQEIAEMIGTEAMLLLTKKWGGRTLYVPKTMPAEHPIAAAIGYVPARRLTSQYGGDRLDIPRCIGAHNERAVLALRRQGLSESRIANELRIDNRSVRRVVRRIKTLGGT
jgi:hypothetical protein